jgi:hypothetical protein
MFSRLEEISKSLIDENCFKTRCRHFSFIIYKRKIISIGMNCNKTHPINLLNPKFSKENGLNFSDQKQVCSELNAILKLKRLTNIQTDRCTLVNLRYDKNKKLTLSKPCSSCENLLKYHNFKKIIWTNVDGEYVSF